jgi:hypothetical protein
LLVSSGLASTVDQQLYRALGRAEVSAKRCCGLRAYNEVKTHRFLRDELYEARRFVMLIAAFWGIFSLAIRESPAEPIVWNLAHFSYPILFVGFYFHFGFRLYRVIATNAAIYGLLGVLAESLRKRQIWFNGTP